MAKKRQLQLGLINVQSKKLNNPIEKKIEYMQWKIEVAKRSGKPLDLDIYCGPRGLVSTTILGGLDLFSPFDFTQIINIRTPFPILTQGEQYQKFMEAIKNAFKTIYLS